MKILIPLDGSSFGEAILDVARRVARLTGAEVHMLQVRDPLEHPVAFEQTGSFRNIVDATGAPVAGSLSFAPDEGLEENYQQLVQQAEREAIDYLEGKGREFAGSELKYHVIFSDDPAREIIDCARREDVDLIMMSTHGRSGLRALVQGSVATEVVRSGITPVVLVRPSFS